MIACPNKSSKEWKDLVAIHDESVANYLWFKYEGDIPSEFLKQGAVGIDNPLQTSIEWIKSVMPDANIELVNDLIDNIGKGSYNTVTDLITLSKKHADKKTAKHEVFHAAWNRLSKEKQEELLNEGSKLFGIPRGESKVDRKLYQIVGENAKLSEEILDNLRVAKEMELAEKDAKIIRLATGWEKGIDDEWRYEIEPIKIDYSVINSFLNEEEGSIYSLTEFLGEDNEIFKLYPNLKDTVVIVENIEGVSGRVDYQSKIIFLNVENKLHNGTVNTIVHELQHLIQREEDFAQGGDYNSILRVSPYELYKLKELQPFIEKKKDEYISLLQKDINLLEDYISLIKNENINSFEDFNKSLTKYLRTDENAFFREDVFIPDSIKLGEKTKKESLLYLKDKKDHLKNVQNNIRYDEKEDLYFNNYLRQNLLNNLKYNEEFLEKYGEIVYHKLSGEVEARNVETRRKLTPEERKILLLSETEKVARDQQIVLRNETIKYQQQNQINYTLKAVDLLQSDKAIQLFKTLEKNKVTGDTFWKKVQELGIPKEQIELLKQYNTTNREELITNMLADYSFVVESNVAKVSSNQFDIESGKQFILNNKLYKHEPLNNEGFNYILKEQNRPEIYITKDEFLKAVNEKESFNSQHYSNLTVPGGTNYTENEIATPLITPSIKGHAQFATDNGIGWFRSDEQNKQVRRVLELQSDLFQKGRNKEDIVKGSFEGKLFNRGLTDSNKEEFLNAKNKGIEIDFESKEYKNSYKYGEYVYIEQFNYKENEPERYLKYPFNDNNKQNQFLQLLNKDNNWVTFFIKSIIQDSAKKGYEKVLFPTGNTASKVEGHSTLEEFKKQKEDRIKELEKKQNILDSNLEQGLYGMDTSDYELRSIKIQEEIGQLDYELERVEKEGFGALKPIYNFYENTVQNILKKQFGQVSRITDEYGNEWFEIDLSNPKVKEQTENIKFQSPNLEYTGDLAIEEKIAEMMENTPDEELPKTALGRWIQSVRNFFRNLFKEKTIIERLLRDINQGRIRGEVQSTSGIKYQSGTIKSITITPELLNMINNQDKIKFKTDNLIAPKASSSTHTNLAFIDNKSKVKSVSNLNPTITAVTGWHPDFKIGKSNSLDLPYVYNRQYIADENQLPTVELLKNTKFSNFSTEELVLAITNGDIDLQIALDKVLNHTNFNTYVNEESIAQALMSKTTYKPDLTGLTNFRTRAFVRVMKNAAVASDAEILMETTDLQNAAGKNTTIADKFNPIGHLESKISNLVGKDVIGIAATGLKIGAAIQTYFNKVEQKGKYNWEQITFNDNTYYLDFNSVDSTQVEDSAFANLFPDIAAELKGLLSQPRYDFVASQFLSAATDNAKLLILKQINADTLTSGVFITLLLYGVSVDEVIRFFKSPIIEYLFKKARKNVFSTESFERLEDVIDQVMQEGLDEQNKKLAKTLKDVYIRSKELRALGQLLSFNQGLRPELSQIITMTESIKELLNIEDADMFTIIRETVNNNYTGELLPFVIIQKSNDFKAFLKTALIGYEIPKKLSYQVTIADAILQQTKAKDVLGLRLSKAQRTEQFLRSARHFAKDMMLIEFFNSDGFRKYKKFFNVKNVTAASIEKIKNDIENFIRNAHTSEHDDIRNYFSTLFTYENNMKGFDGHAISGYKPKKYENFGARLNEMFNFAIHKTGFDSVKDKVFEGTDITVGDIIYLYDLILNRGTLRTNSFAKYMSATSLQATLNHYEVKNKDQLINNIETQLKNKDKNLLKVLASVYGINMYLKDSNSEKSENLPLFYRDSEGIREKDVDKIITISNTAFKFGTTMQLNKLNNASVKNTPLPMIVTSKKVTPVTKALPTVTLTDEVWKKVEC